MILPHQITWQSFPFWMAFIGNIMKYLLLIFSFHFCTSVFAYECHSKYLPSNVEQGTKKNIHQGVIFVEPPYAGFDPCNSSVDIKISVESDTFILVLHGSGGADENQKEVARRFKNEGFSVLSFDSFLMNKLSKNSLYWSTQVHQSSTSRMIYFSGLAALKWISKNHPDKSKKIFVYGHSLGGMAAINLAATNGIDSLVKVIAEAPGETGIGLPDKLLKPVYIFYGNQDNYGGRTLDEFLWNRKSFCLWNAPSENTPSGNVASCNYSQFIWGSRAQSVSEYVTQQQKAGSEVSLVFFDDAAHAIFNGKNIDTQIRTTPSGIKFYSSLGSKSGVADKVFEDILLQLK